jgi:hypothetical protein
MTNGVVSVVVNGAVVMKLVAAHDGQSAPKVAGDIRRLQRVPTVEEAQMICDNEGFGCRGCLVIATPDNPCGRYADEAKEDPKGMARYIDTFNDPRANPRWEHEAEYIEIVDTLPPASDMESVRSIAERTNLAQEIGFAGEDDGSNFSDQAILARAWRIATEVHAFQLDKNGQSYLFHVARVAMAGETVLEQVCGLLHDILEDSPNASQWVQVFDVEFPPEVLDCLVALWHKEDEPYMDYIRRVSESPLATKIKLADLHDNLNPERLIALPSDVMHRLLTKYGQAVKLLVMSKGPR